jgi:hypothetical protein
VLRVELTIANWGKRDLLLSLALDWKKLRCVLEVDQSGQTAGWALVERVSKTGPQGRRFLPPFHKRLDKLKVSAWGHDDDQNRDHCLVRLLARH